MIRTTILIPTYNAGKTISETLKSVDKYLKTKHNISAVYIADDCSSDLTLSKCKETWGHKSTELIILNSDVNLGERGNVNRALVKLKNNYDWILLLHADDLAKQNWLDEMCLAIERATPNIASISSSYDVLHVNKIDRGEDENTTSFIEGNQSSIKDTLNSGTWWHISGCAINLRIFFISGGFNNQMPQYGDMEWILRVFNLGYGIMYISKSLTMYRQIDGSVSSRSFKTHTDIFEYSNLVINYQHLFNKVEMTKIYLMFNKQLFKRNIKALINRDVKRFKSSIRMTCYLFRLFIVTKKPDINFSESNVING